MPEFIEPKNWPPNSPDLNPVDYSIWGCLQQLVYREVIQDVDHLKQVLVRCWVEISQGLGDSDIDQWARRVNAVIEAHGGHIEYLLDYLRFNLRYSLQVVHGFCKCLCVTHKLTFTVTQFLSISLK